MIIPLPTDRDEWLRLRAPNVGASEIAALFGVQADYAMSAYTLWHVKAGRAPAPDVQGPRPKWGLRLEEAIAAAVTEEHKWLVHKGGYATDDTTPGLGCTLDYIARKTPDGPPGCLELKNVDWMVHRRSWTNNEPPLHILLQLQAQLACTGFEWGAVAGLVGGNDLHVYPYVARPKLIADIRARTRRFWQSIADDKPPQPDGSDSEAAIFRALYATATDEEVVDLEHDNELPELCAEMLEAADTKKTAEKAYTKAKNRILAKIGPYLRARAQGFWINVSVTPEKLPRPAVVGDIISGRAESRTVKIKERTA